MRASPLSRALRGLSLSSLLALAAALAPTSAQAAGPIVIRREAIAARALPGDEFARAQAAEGGLKIQGAGKALDAATISAAVQIVISARAAALSQTSALLGLPLTSTGRLLHALTTRPDGRIELTITSTGGATWTSHLHWKADETILALLQNSASPGQYGIEIRCRDGVPCVQEIYHHAAMDGSMIDQVMPARKALGVFPITVPTASLKDYLDALEKAYTYLQTHAG